MGVVRKEPSAEISPSHFAFYLHVKSLFVRHLQAPRRPLSNQAAV